MDYKGIQIDDKNITYVKLPGGTYLVDGEIVKNDNYISVSRVQCKNPNDIRRVTENKYIKEYVSGDVRMTLQEYNKNKYELAVECIKSENDGYTEYNSLQDEFKYRSFLADWKPIYATEQVVSEPIKVEIEHIKYDTGNKYIRSAFLNGADNEDTLYSYHQAEAWPDIVKECFDELHMEYQQGLSFSATANKKIWSNSDHSCIRFVVAFGTYVMGDTWGNPRVIKGTLQDMINQYETDKKVIRNIIIRQYKKHFGDIDAGTFDFKTLLSTLKRCGSLFSNVQPKAKTADYYWSGVKCINAAIQQIETAFQTVEE